MGDYLGNRRSGWKSTSVGIKMESTKRLSIVRMESARRKTTFGFEA